MIERWSPTDEGSERLSQPLAAPARVAHPPRTLFEYVRTRVDPVKNGARVRDLVAWDKTRRRDASPRLRQADTKLDRGSSGFRVGVQT